MSEFEKTKSVIFPVSALYIQLDTNTGANGESNIQLFKRSMIKMPKMDTPPQLTSEYPFFTKNVRYPKSIENDDWKKKYEFFFNRVMFMDRLREEIEHNPGSYKESLTSKDESESKQLYEWMQETETHNVMVTLRAIFPIPEVFGKAMKNSYDHILKNESNLRIGSDINIRSVANIFGFMYKFGIASKEKEEYFINIEGKRYEVDDVVWENDLINHPVYKSFLNSQRATYEEVEKSAPEVEEKYLTYMRKLDDDLTGMLTKEHLQRDFFKLSGECNPPCEYDEKNETKMSDFEQKLFEFFKKNIKNANINEIKLKYVRDIKDGKDYKPLFQYLTHTHLFKKYYDEWKDKNNLDPTQIINNTSLQTSYDIIKNLTIQKYTDIDQNKDKIKENFNVEFHAIFSLEHEDPTETLFEKEIVDEYLNYLKSDTISMLRMHIKSKLDTLSRTYPNMNTDRKNTITTIVDKLKRLSNETGDSAVETILSIKEDLDNHRQLHNSEGISVFMERDYEAIFDRILKSAVEIKAASIVLKFAKNNVPMNLTGKKLDGSEVSSINQRIIKYIGDFFGTEASINNQLSTNVNNVYEPVRKTSNKELYKVLKLFKLGDVIMKKEYKMSSSEIDEYREVLEKIHDQYISNRQKTNVLDNALDKYLYTGVDEVKSTAGSGEEKKTESEVRRNVQEIYVRLDLVDADMFKKASKPGCKLMDKELEQEFMYLVDPRNKNNTTLSRFRNLNFESVAPNSMIAESGKPEDVKKSTNPLINVVPNVANPLINAVPDGIKGGSRKRHKWVRRTRSHKTMNTR